MKIAACIKQVPDTETKIKLKADGSGVDFSSVKWVINPYDEYAIEEGIKLRDANPGSQLIIFTVGPKARAGDALRTALAMGADEGVLIDAPDHLDVSATALILAEALKKEGPFDLVLSGKLAIDDNAASVSQMLAQELNFSHLTVVSKLTLSAGVVVAEREVEGGTKEIFEIKLPAVIGANKGLNTPRYASLPGIMKAKKKTLKEYSMATLGIDESKQKTRFSKYKLPPEKPAVKIIPGDAKTTSKEVVRLLREEVKVV